MLIMNETCHHTDLVKLDSIKLCAQVTQGLFGGSAVGAVGFAEDGCITPTSATVSLKAPKKTRSHTDSILINDFLGLGLCGGHGCGVDARGEETA